MNGLCGTSPHDELSAIDVEDLARLERDGEVVETHSAVVTFAGDRVYKRKKPVDLGFLDFSERQARAEACRREVELNSRLASDVYLGVADVVATEGVVDHVVVMRRLTEERRLATLVSDEWETSDCVRQIAHDLVAFHSRASGPDQPAEFSSVDAVGNNWDDNVEVIGEHVPEVIDSAEFDLVRHLARRYLAGRQPLFERRINDGHVRDGHGDLLAQDIFCLDDGPRILDCVEFADRYRYGDVLLDATFLAMDLERLGTPRLARRFMDFYRQYSHHHHPASLAHHYIAYRAHVRAKVACIRAEGGQTHAEDKASQLHRLAARHLRAGGVRLVLVGGLPGTGKTTLARAICEARGYALLRSDEIRKDLAGLGHHQPARAAEVDLYAPRMTAATYRELIDRSHQLLAMGQSVTLDATWMHASHRRMAQDAAADTVSDFVQLQCAAATGVAVRRLEDRDEHTVSDATPAVHTRMARQAHDWPGATEINTDCPVGDSVNTALDAVDAGVDRP